jgi:hypothetical protein
MPDERKKPVKQSDWLKLMLEGQLTRDSPDPEEANVCFSKSGHSGQRQAHPGIVSVRLEADIAASTRF